jgi:hypothetical protein
MLQFFNEEKLPEALLDTNVIYILLHGDRCAWHVFFYSSSYLAHLPAHPEDMGRRACKPWRRHRYLIACSVARRT